MACVHRATQRNRAAVYPIPLQQPLPNIRVLLRPTDEDAVLRLQELIDDCYRDSRYATWLDYRLDPVPPLGESDARWVDGILRKKDSAKGRRINKCRLSLRESGATSAELCRSPELTRLCSARLSHYLERRRLLLSK